MSSSTFGLGIKMICFAIFCVVIPNPAWECWADDSHMDKVKAIVSELRKAEEKVERANGEYPICEKIELASWQLMLGEYAASYPDMSLPTTSINCFLAGKELLSEIEGRIKANPSLEMVVSSSPLIALRLDTARIRLGLFEQKLALSRQAEIKRLTALRLLNNNYLKLNQDLTDWMTSQTVGDAERSLTAARNCLVNLNKIYLDVDGGKDLHLFSDEPKVDGNLPFKNSDLMPVPFSSDGVSLLKSIQALVYLQMAQSEVGLHKKYLPLARKWAAAARDNTVQLDGMPEGADPENFLAKLVVALCDDTEGSQISLDSDPVKRKSGREMLVRASQGLKEFKNSLEAKGFDPSAKLKLMAMASQKLEHLERPDGLLEMAQKSILEGQPSRARNYLMEALKRHPEQEIVAGYILTGLRHGVAADELREDFNKYENLNILDSASPEVILLSTRLNNSKAALVLQQGGDIGQVISDLTASRRAIEPFLDGVNVSESVVANLKANASLAFVYCWALGNPNGDGSAVKKNDVTKVYRLARDAEFHFKQSLDALDQNQKANASSVVEQREALVASRLALGHLAALGLDDWRDESRIFFTAAADEAGKLNQSSHLLKMLSTPLLRHVLEKNDGGSLKLASDERQKRQMMTMSIEAMYASRFGEKNGAAKQMAKAVAAGKAIQQGVEAQLDMGELSVGADGFDSNVNLLDTVKAFQVISELDAGLTQDAYEHALVLASYPVLNPDIKPGCFEKTISEIQSPLVGYAFGKAIEQIACEIPLKERLAERELLLGFSTEAFQRTEDLLGSERLAEKYSHLAALVANHREDLATPDRFINQIRNSISANQKDQARGSVQAGLSRHPRNETLWRSYFELQIDLAQESGDKSQQGLREMLAELQAVSNIDVLSQFELKYTTGVIYSLLNELDNALEFYQSAIEVAERDSDRIMATAAKTEIQIRQIRVSEGMLLVEGSTN